MHNNRTHELHQKFKYLAREFKPQTQIIKNSHGKTITDPAGIAEVWKQYWAKLFSDENATGKTKSVINELEKESLILKSETEKPNISMASPPE